MFTYSPFVVLWVLVTCPPAAGQDHVAKTAEPRLAENSQPLLDAWNNGLGDLKPSRTQSGTYFAGFVAGRLRCQPPLWWVKVAMQVPNADETRGTIHLDDTGRDWASADKVSFPKGFAVERNGTRLKVKNDEVSFSFNTTYYKDMRAREHLGVSIEPMVAGDSVYVLLSHCLPIEGELCRVDLRTGEKIWTTTVKGNGPVLRTGYHAQATELVLNDRGEIYVFGGGTDGVFIEGFSEKGERILRFSEPDFTD